MLSFSRREFLSLGAAAIAAVGTTHGGSDDILRNPRSGVETFESARVLDAAQRYLREKPETIVSVPAPRSAGGPHDYFSEADYFWPDPQNPNGPYINRDGESNPGNFNTHRLLLIRLSIQAAGTCRCVGAYEATRLRRACGGASSRVVHRTGDTHES